MAATRPDPTSRGGRRLIVAAAAAALLAVLLFPVGGTATVGDVGYRDQAFSGTGTAPTESKPESKLWWADGIWWSVMWNGADNFIYRLDESTHTWSSTGVLADNRAGTRSDVLWDGTHLYVASHGFSNSSTSGFAARLYRYSYNAVTDVYTLDSGFPVSINNFKTETLVIDKDSTGRLWATWTQGTQIYINATTGDDHTWGVPFALPVAGAGSVTTDDISSVIAFGGNKIGVMWSDQNTMTMNFVVHLDGQPTTSWQPKEAALSGPLNADDHINLKTAGGVVYAAVKTSVTTNALPLNDLLVRSTSGTWSTYVAGLHQDHHTRPIVLLDTGNRVIHYFATSDEAGGTVYEKTSPMDAIAFASGLGTPFIRDAASADMNDATSTKQNLNATTGLVVMASNDTNDFYWHNEAELGAPPPPLAADFTATPLSGTAPLGVTFTDASSGGATSWDWDFGDGTTHSTAQNPVHTYAAAGTYSVTLTVSNSISTVARTRASYIAVGSAPVPLAADFTGSPTGGTAPLAVDFTDASAGAPTSWDWDFGDGTAHGTAQNPSHTYTTPGTHSVTLTVRDATNAVSARTRAEYVAVAAPPPPTASFTAAPLSGTAPLAVSFTDTSTGAPTSWDWNFGDGTAHGTTQNASHTYANPGSYTVTLTATNAQGSNTATRTNYIAVSPPPVQVTVAPSADAFVSKTSPTSNSGTDVTLRVKNGGIAATSPHFHSYLKFVVPTLAGAVTSAKLRLYCVDPAANGGIVYGSAGSWTETGITWSNAPAPDPGGLATIGPVNLDAWVDINIPASHFAGGSGTYSFEIQSENPSDGTSWYSSREGANPPQLVLLTSGTPAPAPVASFTATPTSGTAPLTVSFTDTSTGSPAGWSWNFGDGAISTLQNPFHVYETPGTYTVTLTATNTSGSSTATQTNLVTVAAPPPPSASFTLAPASGQAPLAVDFTDTSTRNPTGWDWDFGDGTPHSSAQTPSHTYATPGTYTVTLVASNAGGSTSSTQTNAVTVQSPPTPTASFTATPTSGSAPLTVGFSDTSTGNPTGWDWDFGDGTPHSSAQNPSHTYTTAGTYDVTLTATNSSGSNTVTLAAFVTVASPPPVVQFAPVEDSYVSKTAPTTIYGSATAVHVKNGGTAATAPHYRSYLKFSVTGLTSPVASAKLRLYVVDDAANGGAVYATDNAWSEATLNWNNAPAATGGALAVVGPVSIGFWVEIPIPASVFAAGNGTYSLEILSESPTDGHSAYSSREGGTPPQLVLTTGS